MTTYKIRLKDGVSVSIDKTGLITKTATWIITSASGNAYSGWKSFEDTALLWAGRVGDGWKEPTQDTSGRECSNFTTSSLFKVTGIDVASVNRTHYEVTFTAEQNLSAMTLINNADVSIDSLNQKTVSLNYQIDLSTGAFSELEALFYTPGSALVLFNHAAYLLDRVDYTATSKTRYSVAVVLRDMSVMRLGNPKYSVDAYGGKTASISWRYSASAYSPSILPAAGADVSAWLGLSASSGYTATNVNVEPDGLLGYTVTVEAKHVSNRLVKTAKSYELDTDYSTDSEPAVKKAVTVTRQATKDDLEQYDEIVGTEGDDFGHPGTTVSSVQVEEVGRDDFEVTLELTDDEFNSKSSSGFNNSQNYLKNQVDLSINYSEVILEASHLGYVRGESGIDWVAINDPPTTMFEYDMDIDGLKGMNDAWTDGTILTALKTGKIGFSVVKSIKTLDGRYLSWPEVRALTSLSGIATIRLSDFVYAQPSQKKSDGTSVRNIYFVPWKAKDSALLFDTKTTHPTLENGFDKPLRKSAIGARIPTIECSVGKYYKGRLSKVIKRWEHRFYTDAIAELDLKDVTSYKRTNLSAEEVTDNTGRFWTKVTQTLSGLRGFYWNKYYQEGSLDNA